MDHLTHRSILLTLGAVRLRTGQQMALRRCGCSCELVALSRLGLLVSYATLARLRIFHKPGMVRGGSRAAVRKRARKPIFLAPLKPI